ncbi:heat shock protein Hsp20 [Desulfobulbus propionicus DSM 2032]|jgi:HSP20 family protein|uniref:Heat shock protein Hsp20 n=1 Tax=Desulfobulbus propionicus (strain ATCC 33891 / DSM 2032 / VKM B-1956 / 1pr3) TaxID=577650 RepID=A0A7U4DPA7_DESPD|nr:Hsp20/alpha crystallin family protein [Desulfobulbus propionicus]ADW17941.1 heat shock protein Hsp20 [Desulfobulbus propionicus DSM 2032]
MAFIRFADRPAFRNPWAEFERIRQGLDELSRSYADKGKGQARANVYPALNIYEESDRLIVTAELPGVKVHDLELSVEGETLTIQGKRDSRQNDPGISYHRREIESGSFSRAIALPVKIDTEQVGAKLSNGILTITLMKASEVKPRQIKVTAE